MTRNICIVPVSPLRSEPSHRTEMVTQQLFGESCTILESTIDHWIRVKCSYDGYEGWCQDMHVKEFGEEITDAGTWGYTANLIETISYNNEQMHLPFGSSIPLDEDVLEALGVQFKGTPWNAAAAKKDDLSIQAIAFRFLNTGYLWGGKSIFGIDCSGYTQSIYKLLNVPLLRDASQQATQGEEVSLLEEARCGDLAFFDNENGKITHVGLLLNNKEIIHSSGKVRVDKIDTQGIVNKETGERTHSLRVVKRYW